ncbi:MAG: hypothetical protein [Wendovervirus sonii]|uniref:Uncharacterized protein n=1 Tax=phage Lak_Megaphage_Sonny TaxID=3109229 RepID=A0ABZ0Z447_9CAUD|nr:MAG: hypothetical protein [phage Lak_Megaphage_Sonny]
MKINQRYLDNLNDDEFIKKILIDTIPNIEVISDNREIIQYTNDDRYYIKFNYTFKFIKKCLFTKSSTVFNKIIIDKIFFKSLEDAEFYFKNAKCPSVSVGNNKEYTIWNKIYLVGEIGEKFKSCHIQLDAAYINKDKKLYFGKYHTNDFNNVSIRDAIKNISYAHNILFNNGYKSIKIGNINDTLSEKEHSINILKKSFDENKDTLTDIILEEIDRTKNYLDFLIRIAQK